MANEEVKSAAAIWILRAGSKTSDELRERLEGAALRVWPKAEGWARQELWGTSLADDSAVISDVWEESLQSVLRSLQRKTPLRPIRDLDSYLFGTFCHRLRRRITKENELDLVRIDGGLDKLKSAQDWPVELEEKLLLEQALKFTDPWTKRALFRRQLMGKSWREVARVSGMNARQAMKTFHYRLNKVRETIGVAKRNTTKPV